MLAKPAGEAMKSTAWTTFLASDFAAAAGTELSGAGASGTKPKADSGPTDNSAIVSPIPGSSYLTSGTSPVCSHGTCSEASCGSSSGSLAMKLASLSKVSLSGGRSPRTLNFLPSGVVTSHVGILFLYGCN